MIFIQHKMNFLKRKTLTAIILVTVISLSVKAQTNVSGGIFSNTTWTLANSPYIVTDTIVVFPNVTLTIEPGVIVKFANNKRIEIRQAKLVANGTSVDSITFTSDSSAPTVGIYPGIYLNGGNLSSTFNYCNFNYAAFGIKATVFDTLIVKNSKFNQNITGLQFIGNLFTQVALIDSVNFNSNTNGLIIEDLFKSSINYCNFSYNNSDGFILGNGNSSSQGSVATTNYCNFSNNGIGLLMDLHTSAINYCHFSFNTTGLQGGTGAATNHIMYNNSVNDCIFDFNQTGLYTADIIIDGCTISNNQTGYTGSINRIKNCTIDSNSVIGLSAFNDSVINCSIKFNGVGIQSSSFTALIGNDIEYNTIANISSSTFLTNITGNTIKYSNKGIDNVSGNFLLASNIIENNNFGIILNSSTGTISCNRICNNTIYDLQYGSSSNLDASHNYWCNPDSASLEALIYDGYDNINYGLVSFIPMDTVQCYLATGISIDELQSFSINIFPDPATDNIILELPVKSSKVDINIFSMLGELVYSSIATGQKITLDISTLSKGAYIIEVASIDRISRKKFIRE